MTSHAVRLAAILVAAIAVLVAYVVLSSSGGETGVLEGMLIVLFPALVDASAEQQRRAVVAATKPAVDAADAPNERE